MAQVTDIPVFRPKMLGTAHNLLEALSSSWWGTGPKVKDFERVFAEYIGVTPAQCIMLNSCTAALHLAVKMFPDAERVLVPGITFISSALAPLYEDKKVVLVDVGEDLCIDQDDALSKLQSPKDIVMVVHMGGHAANFSKLEGHCRIIEDCAHALGSYDRTVATPNAFHVGSRYTSCFSFQATKLMPIGDGGMLVLRDGDKRKRAEALAWCGIGESTWDRAQGEYRWQYGIEEVGYKYRANDIQAAIALDQWTGLDALLARKRETADKYQMAFSSLTWLKIPHIRTGTRPSWQEYTIRVDHRDELYEHLQKLGIASTVHYAPLNEYSVFQDRGEQWMTKWDLPVAERLAREILTIPAFGTMTNEEVGRVIDGIRSFQA